VRVAKILVSDFAGLPHLAKSGVALRSGSKGRRVRGHQKILTGNTPPDWLNAKVDIGIFVEGSTPRQTGLERLAVEEQT